jgi:prepilin-type N-terminal cleavage/methylation domain-containing protein
MKRRGFTIVELIITITIMGILLTLAVVNVNVTQAKARDDERKGDIDSIASALEAFYASGTSTSANLGRYPSVGLTGSYATLKNNLPDIDMKSLAAPGIAVPTDNTLPASFVVSTNTGTAPSIQTTAGVTPQPTISQYVYQPIRSDGGVCQSIDVDCRKYNLFYRLENDNTIHRVTSKNQ